MARLDENQVLSLLNEAAANSDLVACMQDHERLRLHVEQAHGIDDASPAIQRFLDGARKIMTPKKYEKFEALLRFPLESNKLAKKVFADLRRVFDGKNRAIRFEFANHAAEREWHAFRRQVLRDEEFFEEDYFEHIRTGIHDFLLVDVEGAHLKRPKPVYRLIRVEDVSHVDVNADNLVEYIIYREGAKRVVVDAASYRVYEPLEKAGTWRRTVYEPHKLGEAPAKPLWSDYKRSKSNFLEKEGPISASLSDMDEVNFWDVGNRYYQLYGAFPIYWEYKTQCKWQDEHGNACDNGYIHYFEHGPANYDPQSGKKLSDGVEIPRKKRCPECEKNDNIFAGSRVQVEAPMSREDADLREPMGFVKVDAAALKFNDETQQKRRQYVVDYCVGINAEGSGQQAMNEEQVNSFFEDRKAVLFRVKRNIELCHEWALKIACRLRYGSQFSTVYVNYGDEFYLRTESEQVANYEVMRKAGLPSYMLHASRQHLTATRFRTDPQACQRMDILAELEPYPDYTLAELMLMKAQFPAAVNTVQLTIKMNFSNFVARFERENGNILIFASNLDYKDKIKRITDKLNDYADREIKQNQQLAAQEHAELLQRLEAEARANGAGNQAGKPGSDASRQGDNRRKPAAGS